MLVNNQEVLDIIDEKTINPLPYGSPTVYVPNVKWAKSFNDLALSFLCTSILKNDNYKARFADSLVEFSDLSEDQLINDRQRIALASYECLKSFLKEEDVKIRTLSERYQKKIKGIELTEENVKFSTEVYVSMMSMLNMLLETWNNSSHVMVDYKTFRSYGRMPRETYTTSIDLFSIDEKGKTTAFLFTPKQGRHDNIMFKYQNIRVLHVVKHFEEIGINLDKICEIRIPLVNGDNITHLKYSVTDALKHAANVFYKNDYTLHENMAMCSVCPMYNGCSPLYSFGHIGG